MAQKGKRLARYVSQASQKCITLSVNKNDPVYPRNAWNLFICSLQSNMVDSNPAFGDNQIKEFIYPYVNTN